MLELSMSLESHKVNTARIDGSFMIASAFGRARKENEKSQSGRTTRTGDPGHRSETESS